MSIRTKLKTGRLPDTLTGERSGAGGRGDGSRASRGPRRAAPGREPGAATRCRSTRRKFSISAVAWPVVAWAATVRAQSKRAPAISRLAKEGAQALVVMLSPILRVERRRIVKLALAQRWPVAGASGWAEAGALLSYSADALANYRRAAYYVDRILKGAKPADLPIEQSTKFELVINMKTARLLKLEIPRELAVRADRVIE